MFLIKESSYTEVYSAQFDKLLLQDNRKMINGNKPILIHLFENEKYCSY